jgi:hypothetical protein
MSNPLRKLLSPLNSLTVLIVLFALVLVFHLCVLAGLVPQQYVWGGRITSREDLIQKEAVSLLLNAAMLLLCFRQRMLLRAGRSSILLRIVFGLMAVLFAINTLGNLMAEQSLETIIFTPITVLLAALSLHVAVVGRK